MDSVEPTTPAFFGRKPRKIRLKEYIAWDAALGSAIGTVLGQLVSYAWLGTFNLGIAIGGFITYTIWSSISRKRELEDEQRKSI